MLPAAGHNEKGKLEGFPSSSMASSARGHASEPDYDGLVPGVQAAGRRLVRRSVRPVGPRDWNLLTEEDAPYTFP
jgi:hypothetical protein